MKCHFVQYLVKTLENKYVHNYGLGNYKLYCVFWRARVRFADKDRIREHPDVES